MGHTLRLSVFVAPGKAVTATVLAIGLALIMHLGNGNYQAAVARTDSLLAMPDPILFDCERAMSKCSDCGTALGAFYHTAVGITHCAGCHAGEITRNWSDR